MKKIGLLALGLALALGVVAEAGSIPADRVPLQTYAVKKMNCYLQPNGVQKGWIDPGDYVVVTQIRNDGWAYGSYPVGNGRVSRWFRADDLVNNIGFANQERYSPKANTNTYTGSDHSRKFGSFNDNEPILVVSDSGQSRQFIYKVNGGGYKMAWAPYWDCWDARQAGKQQVNNNVINKNPIMKPVQREDKKQEQTSYGVWKATARYTANTYDNPDLRGARAGWITNGSDIEVLGENAKSYFIRYWADNGAKRERYVERTAVKGLNEDKENKKQVNNNVINRNPIVKPVQREDKKQEQTSYGVWKATARYTANTYDNPDLRGARAGWITNGSDIEVLGENAKSYFIRYWADNGAKRERYVERTAVKGLNEDKENKQQVNNNVSNKNPIVKPVQREDKKQEQSSSYGVWKATARYRANTYDNPNLSGARAGWVTVGSALEVLGENAKSYFIRYWADNGAKRERYVERTAVKGLNEDKENKQQVNKNVSNKNPIVKPVQREDKKQEQASSYGVWKATARYTANTYDNPDLRGMRAGRVTSGSDIEVLGENAKSYFIRYWADNGAKRERYVERTAVKGLNEYKDDNQIGEYVWPIDAYKISCLYYYSGYNDKNKTYNPIKHDATYGRNPSYGFYYWNAMDIEAKNVPVKATADGTVDRVAVFPLSSYGPHIIIRHKDGRYSLYAHLKTGSILVKENQEVKKGQQIANSGYSLSKDKNPKQSWHLHFAITEVGAWQYFRDRVSLCYGNRVIGANKTQASKDNYSKDATEWFNKHNGSYK
ncbi:M23 family metallopeptidase, partial [Phascolarctobacterium succinatutens]|uniref:M23 family metallopeptidase n=1 Tax=Phascolarctobacterium succinatutens TaxID=626940 RepID=UPI003AEF27FE